MINRRIGKMPPWAKYAIVAMFLADGVGIYLAHNRINRPVLTDQAEQPELAMADPAQKYGDDGLLLARPLPEVAFAAVSPPRPVQTLPTMLSLKPLDLPANDDVLAAARIEQRADRAAETPVVRVATVRQSRRQARLFTKAFARELASPALVESSAPDADFAQVRAARDLAGQNGGAYDDNLPERPLSSVQQIETPAQEQAAEPVSNADAPVAPAEAAPAASEEGELPPS